MSKNQRKGVAFVNNTTREELKGLPEIVRQRIGYQLHQLHQIQEGGSPDDFKAISTVGSGVIEIRVSDENNDNIDRCFLYLKSQKHDFYSSIIYKKIIANPRKKFENWTTTSKKTTRTFEG